MRFGCRPWICSSVTTETGASASMARSSVLVAATVMVSSDCTGVPPICARAFITGAEACASCSGLAGLRLACFCFFCSDALPAASASAACVKAGVEDINANENTDAPKTKARECLTPKAMCPNLFFKSLGSGWRASRNLRGCLLATTCRDRATPHVSRPSWLRRSAGTVNCRQPLFISIVNCGGWIARRSNCTRVPSRELFGA